MAIRTYTDSLCIRVYQMWNITSNSRYVNKYLDFKAFFTYILIILRP
jgi:hypothetical protein